nr:hypothetical protein [Sicyoidochytrium minutum DNA virus]
MELSDSASTSTSSSGLSISSSDLSSSDEEIVDDNETLEDLKKQLENAETELDKWYDIFGSEKLYCQGFEKHDGHSKLCPEMERAVIALEHWPCGDQCHHCYQVDIDGTWDENTK